MLFPKRDNQMNLTTQRREYFFAGQLSTIR